LLAVLFVGDVLAPGPTVALLIDLGMNVSGLHHHFKAVTKHPPLQLQKRLRLLEARRLLLSESLDAATVDACTHGPAQGAGWKGIRIN
jgi:methylphosphotriester-DNA--protein-cysteine methyltransferase